MDNDITDNTVSVSCDHSIFLVPGVEILFFFLCSVLTNISVADDRGLKQLDHPFIFIKFAGTFTYQDQPMYMVPYGNRCIAHSDMCNSLPCDKP